MEGDCLAVDLKVEGVQCTLTAVLTDGSITLQGASLTKHIPGATAPSQDVYSITGGTGAYVGASGTMRRSGNGKADTDVFRVALGAPLPSGSISAALAACSISGWPHFQQ